VTKLLLVRHGETEWNAEGRIQGWAPVGLSERGRRQAERVSAYLADRYDITAVVSSDLQRTVETADTIADGVGQPTETDRRLRERHFGVYQGLLSATFFDRFPEMDLLESGRDAAEYTPESGESWVDVRERVFAAIDDLEDGTGTTVVVTHVNPIRILLGNRKGLDLVSTLTELSVDNCSVTEIGPDGRIRSENETVFLESTNED